MGRPKKYATDEERRAAKALRERTRRERETAEKRSRRLEKMRTSALRRRQKRASTGNVVKVKYFLTCMNERKVEGCESNG